MARLERAVGDLTRAACASMERDLPWFSRLSAANRSWVSVVAHTGIQAFVTWYAKGMPGGRDNEAAQPVPTSEVFSAAPAELARVITLRQTVELVRTAITVVEEHTAELAVPGEEARLREDILRYSREIAFAAAQVYAAAAESRGAWDARLEALVMDSIVRGEVDASVRSRAAALGWEARPGTVTAVGAVSRSADTATLPDQVHRLLRPLKVTSLTGVHDRELIVVLAGAGAPESLVERLLPLFGDGPVVIGPAVADLDDVRESIAAARAGRAAAPAWPDHPRPVRADDLLPERVLVGDLGASRRLVEDVYKPLHDLDPELVVTLSTFLVRATTLEATARLLFVHANTVRYRLSRVSDLVGLNASNPRDAQVLRTAIAVGRLAAGNTDNSAPLTSASASVHAAL